MSLRRWAETFGSWLQWVAIFSLLFILAVTMIDVIGAKLFLHPLKAATELVGFGQLVAIACALTASFFAGRQVAVEFFVLWLPRKAAQVVGAVAALLSLAFCVILVWQSYLYGVALARSGEITPSARLPLYPFAYVLAVCFVSVGLYFLAQLGRQGGAEHDPN
ncbi:MAG: TRAP transporter small permease [Moorellales bacterium]